MSVAYFSGETAAPLRGDDVTNALLELLAITRWGQMGVLILDFPSGLGAVRPAIRQPSQSPYP